MAARMLMMVIRPENLAWIAGFLEGEGSFCVRRSRYGVYAVVSASQKDREVLDRLVALVGGNVYRDADCHKWHLARSGEALELMRLVLPHMSTRRRDQIQVVLSSVTPPGLRNGDKTHCIRGHEFTEENTYLHGGQRSCRKCRAELARVRRAA